jgi:esterase
MTSIAESVPVRLHYEERGRGPDIVIVHGLFGSLSNWRSVARTLAEHHRVLSVDLRNHGRSPHARPHSYAAMLSDLELFFDDVVVGPAVVIGHSMGGRVAMHLALSSPKRVRALCVLDVSPLGGPNNQVRNILELMRGLDPSVCTSRREAGELLAQQIDDPGLAASILMNIGRRDDGTLFWRLGIDPIAENFDGLREAPPDAAYNGDCLFVRGGASSYLPRDHDEVVRERFPNAQIETLDGAGHLLHVDSPADLRRLLEDFCGGLD